MRQEGAKFVCGKCGGWFQPGIQGRRLVAAGVIARRVGGRSLRLNCTPAGVTGHLRRTPAAAGGWR